MDWDDVRAVYHGRVVLVHRPGKCKRYSPAPSRSASTRGFTYCSFWLVGSGGFFLESLGAPGAATTLFLRCLDWESLESGMPRGILISSAAFWISGREVRGLPATLGLLGERWLGRAGLLGLKALLCQ